MQDDSGVREEKFRERLRDLDGKWTGLSRVLVAVTPIIMVSYVPLMVWVTNEAFESRSHRQHPDIRELRVEIEEHLDTKLEKLIEQIDVVKGNQIRVITTLEGMKGSPLDGLKRGP